MHDLVKNSAASRTHGLLSGKYWGELRVFAEVAKVRSFNRAADTLGMSQPTISRKVKRLQDLIGSQLIISTTLGVKLTKEGEELAQALMTFDRSIFSIAETIRRNPKAEEGLVRISITDGIAGFFVAPKVSSFSDRYPSIQLRFRSILPTSDLVDLSENDTDIFISFSPTERPGLTCRRLGTLHFVPIASKQYIAKMGLPTQSNLEQHQFIQSSFFESRNPVWTNWQRICARGHISHFCDDPFTYGLLAKSGLGIAMVGTYVIAEPIAVPLDLGFTASLPLYAIALDDRLSTRPIKIVYDWLSELLGDASAWLRTEVPFADIPPTFEALRLLSPASARSAAPISM